MKKIMKAPLIMLALSLIVPFSAQAIYTEKEPIVVLKSKGNSENLPQINRETFFLSENKLNLLKRKKDELDETAFLSFFEQQKIRKVQEKSDYFEMIVDDAYGYFDLDEEYSDSFFIVIDRFEGSHIMELYVFKNEKMFKANKPSFMMDDLMKKNFAYKTNNVGGVYATNLAFVNGGKMITDLHFNETYATYLDIINEYEKIK